MCVLMDQGGGIKFSSLIINACTLEGNIIKELLWCWGLILRVPLGGGGGWGWGFIPLPMAVFLFVASGVVTLGILSSLSIIINF